MFANLGRPGIFHYCLYVSQFSFPLKNTRRPEISQGWVKMFENPGHPVFFSEFCVGVKVFLVAG